MDNDTSHVIKQLVKLSIVSRDLLKVIDSLDGAARMPLSLARHLVSAADAVRVELGESPKGKSDEHA